MSQNTASPTPESRVDQARRLGVRLRRAHTERIARGVGPVAEVPHIPYLYEVEPWLLVVAYAMLVDDLMTDHM